MQLHTSLVGCTVPGQSELNALQVGGGRRDLTTSQFCTLGNDVQKAYLRERR